MTTMQSTMQTLNPTFAPELLEAIRIARRVAWILPVVEAAEYVREIRAALADGDVRGVISAIGLLVLAIGNVEDAWRAYDELRSSWWKVAYAYAA